MWWSDSGIKVFISWSGDTSLKVAKVLKEWIPVVIQNIEPYFSTEDIDKGARWSTDIAKELENADFGILCVTRDNLDSSWLNFEAGALSKAIEKSRVCPFLYDLKPSDISNNPILQFQMTNVDRDDVYKLFKSMNNAFGDNGLEEQRLKTLFELSWQSIDKALKSITSVETDKTDNIKKKANNQNTMLEEMLDLLRSQQILLRTPEKILPVEYFNRVFKDNQESRMKIPFSLLREWDFARDRVFENPDLSNNPDILNFTEITTFIMHRSGIKVRPNKFRAQYIDSSLNINKKNEDID